MKVKRPTCSINSSTCPVYHLCLEACDEQRTFSLPCETMSTDELEDLNSRVEDYRLENGIG